MEMLMLLFYGGSCICYGILLVILVRMGLPSVLVRCLRMAGRRAVLFTRMVFRRHRGKTVRAGFVMAALAAGLCDSCERSICLFMKRPLRRTWWRGRSLCMVTSAA